MFVNGKAVFAQDIIKIVKNYVLIDTDQGIGELNQKIKVYRNIKNNEKQIGEIIILKFAQGKAACKILNYKKGYKLQVGDFVKTIKNPIQPKIEQKEIIKPFTRYTFGYSGNIPSQLLGVSVFSLTNKTGFYGAVRFGGMLLGDDNSDYYENISVNKAENIFGDDQIETGEGSFTFDIGITQFLMRPIYLYIGLGYTSRYGYRRYYDPFEILGSNGKYWIDDPDVESSSVNIFGGFVILSGENVSLNIGYNSSPPGFNVGISYVSPIRYK